MPSGIRDVRIVDTNGNAAGTGTTTSPTVTAQAPYPSGSTILTSASGNKANANAVATLTPSATTTAYISGFQCTASGATTGLPVNVTVVGLLGGTATYTFTFPAGVLVSAYPLDVSFVPPLPASAINTAIVVTLPASGTGGTNAACAAQGYQL